jgi:hypothetical protein
MSASYVRTLSSAQFGTETSSSTQVTVLAPAAFSLAAVQTNAPLVAGADLNVSVTVANLGDVADTDLLDVSVEDVGTEQVELADENSRIALL